MKETSLLKDMWSPKVKRRTELIVPEVTYSNNVGSLNNESWFFDVPYSFRSALDIKYEQRMKLKKPYMVWTQGPILGFKQGDFIHSRCATRAVMVHDAQIMGWDVDKNEMFEGVVVYKEFFVDGHIYTKKRRWNLYANGISGIVNIWGSGFEDY